MNPFHAAILRALPLVPRSVVRRIAGRYIAGETRDDLLRVLAALGRTGLLSTVDLLGENVGSKEEARRAAEEYLRLVEDLSSSGMHSEISLKLTQLGLRSSEPFAAELLEEIVVASEERKLRVCIDMEDSSTTDATLRIFRRLRERHDGVRVAIQAYLRRSSSDVSALLPLAPAIRVCKGIYAEPPELAFEGRRSVRENFLRLVTLLLDGGGYPAIATHDPWLVDRCLRLLESRGTKSESHEFQMLLGVGEALRPRLRAAGSALRLYCPYGPHWYEYSIRRLRENPRMTGYVLKTLFSPKVFSRGHLERTA